MSRVLVTGASGLIGSNLCHKLSELGYEVTAMVREGSNLLGLDGFTGKIVLGDVLRKDRLAQLLDGAEFVFHTAGLVSFDNRLRKELMQVNVVGTANLLDEAIQAGVRRLVHTSSVAAIGIPASGGIADETDEYNRFEYNVAYSDSKHLGEVEVQNAVGLGLDAVIVNPASIVGERDVYSHFGVLMKVLKGKKIAPYVAGGMCVVGVDDVVEGQIAAMRSGVTGARYILGGENLSFKELFTQIAEVVDANPPNVRVPLWSARWAAAILEILSTLTGKPPVLTKAHVVSATLPHYFSSERAKRELGYKPRPVIDAIRKSYLWYLENNLI